MLGNIIWSILFLGAHFLYLIFTVTSVENGYSLKTKKEVIFSIIWDVFNIIVASVLCFYVVSNKWERLLFAVVIAIFLMTLMANTTALKKHIYQKGCKNNLQA